MTNDLAPVAYDPLSRLVCTFSDAAYLRHLALCAVAAALTLIEYGVALAAYGAVSLVVALLVVAHIGLKAGDVVIVSSFRFLKAVYVIRRRPFYLERPHA